MINLCRKEIGEAQTDALGNRFTYICGKIHGHNGVCKGALAPRSQYPKAPISIPREEVDKARRVFIGTMGNTDAHSYIKNRAGGQGRWMLPSMTGDEDRANKSSIKIGNAERTHIRIKEQSTYLQTLELWIETLDILDKIYSNNNDETTVCPLCKEQLSAELFALDAKDEDAMVGMHVEPLSEIKINHRPGNVRYGHRRCNTMQGDLSMEDTFNKMIKILKSNGRI